MEEPLAPEDWLARQAEHERRVDGLTRDHLARRRAGQRHPVQDFLFTYYSHRPAQLRRWHPGLGVGLRGAVEREGWRFYAYAAGVAFVDAAGFRAAHGDTISAVHALLGATARRAPHLGCFGLHEWAMVYRQPEPEVRHAAYPLRLGSVGTDAVVEAHAVRCSHFDAFRFFTAAARPRNRLQPGAHDRTAFEQPGCLHAGMDLYKHAYRLTPAVPSDLTLACFELARDIREVDMRASPYDLSDLGYEPIPVETAVGKAAYVTRQRAFAERAQPLRKALLEVTASLLDAGPQRTGTSWRSRP